MTRRDRRARRRPGVDSLLAVVWFSDTDLRALAGGRSYARAFDYVDTVTGLGELPDGVTAVVPGSIGRYKVRLTGELDDDLDGDCSCPYGQEGNFCKHCVAVGLYLLRGSASGGTVLTDDGSSDPGKFDVRGYLATLTHPELVELLAERAESDSSLFRKLKLAALAAAPLPDLPGLSRQVDLLDVDWLDHDAVDDYVTGADELLDVVRRLVPAHAGAVQPLLRRAARHLGDTANRTADGAYPITESAAQAWQLYLQACAAVPPDQVELADWLVDFQVSGPDWPDVTLTEVLDLLGDTGLDRYRERLAVAAAAEPGGSRWHLRRLQEELLRVSADPDALVEFLAQDLSGPHQFVRAAQVLHEAGRTAEAIDWLERGFDTGQGPDDHRLTTLVDLLADLYRETGRDGEVIGLRERHFVVDGSESAYRALRAAAGRSPHWPPIRARALESLRRRAQDRAHWSAADTLAQVLLDEGEDAEAWHVTQDHRCTDPVVLAVTARRARTHPADAVAVYRPMVAAAVGQTNSTGYEQAARLLLTMRPLFARSGEDFAGYVTQLREANRRKRNFIAELNRNGL
ncbi:SWIM zinc finger family protein [Solwaraspora sp. WMMB335]|uniref:SWIM zinc finger family protein n=1 Tax=Solwaraspora sp. WMMB335 TaxID=3404118 RepID=UPI003B95FD87